MKAKDLQKLKKAYSSNDQIYEHGVCMLGLSEVAFFGKKGTPQQKRKLYGLWKQILKYDENNRNQCLSV